jgi:hypothetical protein
MKTMSAVRCICEKTGQQHTSRSWTFTTHSRTQNVKSPPNLGCIPPISNPAAATHHKHLTKNGNLQGTTCLSAQRLRIGQNYDQLTDHKVGADDIAIMMCGSTCYNKTSYFISNTEGCVEARMFYPSTETAVSQNYHGRFWAASMGIFPPTLIRTQSTRYICYMLTSNHPNASPWRRNGQA